jgi:serine/threonine protein kinase
MVARAKAEQNERLAVAASTVSVPRDSLGPVHPHAPRLQFEFLGPLGEGTYGYVSKVRLLNTGSVYAQKVFRVTDARQRSTLRREVENEVNIMERLSHLHITKIAFWDYDPDKDIFSIVMQPVADCNLLQFLRESCIKASFPRTELTHLTTWFGCLVSALSFAHANDIKHEDIKPGNILIKNRRVYLADFGSAKDFSEAGHSTSTSILAFGTPVYWAPENPPRGRAADVFALGCVFSEMLTVRQKRTLEDYQNARYQRHRDMAYAFRENLPVVHRWVADLRSDEDPVAEVLVEQTLGMLQADKTARPNAATVKRSLMAAYQAVICTVCSD